MLTGVIPRNRKLIQRLKTHPNYTEAMGAALGIVGIDNAKKADEMQPVLKLVLKGGKVVVKWKKGKASSINIYVKRSSSEFAFLGNDASPDYTDPTALPDVANTWTYRAIYVVKDQEVGHFSAEVSITVHKFV